MALIKCPECGRQVSDMAVACPDCGYPIAASNPSGTVKIKLCNIYDGRGLAEAILRGATTIKIRDSRGYILWEGKPGMTASFNLDKPVVISIGTSNGSTLASGTVQPKHSYEFIKIPSMFTQKYALDEIDSVIR